MGDIELQHQKIYNNQLTGSNSLKKCTQLPECIYMGVEELVGPATPNCSTEKGGTAVPASVALDGRTSPKGTPKHRDPLKQQSTRLFGSV